MTYRNVICKKILLNNDVERIFYTFFLLVRKLRFIPISLNVVLIISSYTTRRWLYWIKPLLHSNLKVPLKLIT